MTEQTIHDKIEERKRALAEANNERAQLQALSILMDGNEIQDGPAATRFIERVKCITVGIGRDHTATIYMFEDDIAAVRRLLGQEETDES